MPYYNPLEEDDYNALTEAQYNALEIVETPSGFTVRFRDGKVLLCSKHVFFSSGPCPPCDGHHDGIPTPCTLPVSGQPTCVQLAAADVENCAACTTAPTTEAAWDGSMLFNGSDAWDSEAPFTQTPNGHLIQANISFAPAECLFRLTIVCKNGGTTEMVWQGEKNVGDSPCGIYYKTAGCDTKTLMMVA
jgi:hypothetical protein